MLSRFYERFGHRMVLVLGLTLPLVIWLSLKTRSNNDLETWMPETAPARLEYERFKRTFGVEEFLLIAFDQDAATTPNVQLIESLCGRLERLPGVRKAMSPDRMRGLMKNLEVPDDVAEERLQGLFVSKHGRLIGVAACFSDYGLKHRTETVEEVRNVLKYCELTGPETLMAGAPLFVAELDRLGGKDANAVYFTVTLTICLGLLYYLIREWRLTGLVYGLTLWTINFVSVALDFAGAESNFVLSSIPVLTMVLTMSICVHYLYYYQEAVAEGSTQPIGRALQLAWGPTCIATLTTCLGELALSVSDIIPIRQFSYASAFSSVMAMVAGLGLTPALLVACPTLPCHTPSDHRRGLRLANLVVSRSRRIVFATLMLTALGGLALGSLQSDMTVSEFLPKQSKVKQDFLRINTELASTDSLEAIVDCGSSERPFPEKLEFVRKIEEQIQKHPAVDQTLSLTRFFPNELPQSPLELAALLKRAAERQGEDEFTAHGQQLWRISVRLRIGSGKTRPEILNELARDLHSEPITFTGLTALVDSAQQEIFDGFCQSVLVALGLITVAMMIFLKSVWRGFLTMVPNVAPLIWVYGTMSWLGIPVDIAIMLSGSIALGMSVDGTFHFMSRFRYHCRRIEREQTAEEVEADGTVLFPEGQGKVCPSEIAARHALMESSIPFIQATMTSTLGMFGLTLSSFAPTARFGWVMMALMVTALIGDVLMLPALMHLTYRRRRKEVEQPVVEIALEPHAEAAAA